MGGELVKIELVGALRYSYKGEKFYQNKHYLVKADRAKLLLRLTTDYGLYVFKEVGKAHSPVAEVPVKPRIRPVPVVDTTKTVAEQFDDALAEKDNDPSIETVSDTEEAKADDGGTEV